jgi:hypothetical protein
VSWRIEPMEPAPDERGSLAPEFTLAVATVAAVLVLVVGAVAVMARLYPIVTHKFANVGQGALGTFQAGEMAAVEGAGH